MLVIYCRFFHLSDFGGNNCWWMRYTFFAPHVSVRLNRTVCAFKSKINCISLLKSCRAMLCVQGDHCGWTLRFVYFELLLLLCFGQMKIRLQQYSEWELPNRSLQSLVSNHQGHPLRTGWPFRLIQASHWHQYKSYVLDCGPCRKTQPLFWCQREVWHKLNGQFILDTETPLLKSGKVSQSNSVTESDILHCQRSFAGSEFVILKARISCVTATDTDFPAYSDTLGTMVTVSLSL